MSRKQINRLTCAIVNWQTDCLDTPSVTTAGTCRCIQILVRMVGTDYDLGGEPGRRRRRVQGSREQHLPMARMAGRALRSSQARGPAAVSTMSAACRLLRRSRWFWPRRDVTPVLPTARPSHANIDRQLFTGALFRP